MLHNHKHVEYKHRNTNTYRLETRPEERNQDQEKLRKQDKRREIAESRRLAKEQKINKRMKAERKGKSRQLKLMIWKTIDEMICRAILEIQSV